MSADDLRRAALRARSVAFGAGQRAALQRRQQEQLARYLAQRARSRSQRQLWRLLRQRQRGEDI